MSLKELLTLGIFVIFVLPSLFGLLFWSSNLQSKSPEENTKTGVEMIVDFSMPWWLGLAGWAASIGSLGIVIFLAIAFVIKETGLTS